MIHATNDLFQVDVAEFLASRHPPQLRPGSIRESVLGTGRPTEGAMGCNVASVRICAMDSRHCSGFFIDILLIDSPPHRLGIGNLETLRGARFPPSTVTET